ncbi:MAG: ribulose-phosphate 3-epimerase [Lachnospiraceae bacterium]|nr:ribulose-phosphate 3-epimerase [Lachnospiraceae bacterium]
MLEIAPSILSADFAKLGENIKTVEQEGVKYLHIDVMDGLFVPSISFGMPIISSIRKITDMVFDVHLMIESPERYIEEFARCGADIITVHAEACKHLDRVVTQIKEAGCKAAVALNPATPLNAVEYVLDMLDMVLIMSVNPGFGGQKYIPYSTEKIKELKKMIENKGISTLIEVDGGVNASNVVEIMEAGVDIAVMGSAVFGGEIKANIEKVYQTIKK